MFGPRARLGAVIPSSNTTVEPEWNRSLPDGTAVFGARVYQEETSDPERKIATVLSMRSELGRAARELTSVVPSAIGYACTAGSFLGGSADDRATCQKLSSATGVPVITASGAVSVALRMLGAGSIGLVTPYIPEIDQREVAFLDEEGFKVRSQGGPAIVGNLPKGCLSLDASRDAVSAIDLTNVDAVFVSCTNWQTLGNIAYWAKCIDRPVISSNQALLWALLRLSGIEDALMDLGCLATVRPMKGELRERAEG